MVKKLLLREFWLFLITLLTSDQVRKNKMFECSKSNFLT